MNDKDKEQIKNAAAGTIVGCVVDEFYAKFFKMPNGNWERIAGEGNDPLDFQKILSLSTTTLSPVPTQIEIVACNLLKQYKSYCKHVGLSDEITKTLNDPEYVFTFYKIFPADNHIEYGKALDQFQANYHNRHGFDWFVLYFLANIGKYRSFGRPNPMPDISDSIGGIVNAVSTNGFLTTSMVETNNAFENFLYTLLEE